MQHLVLEPDDANCLFSSISRFSGDQNGSFSIGLKNPVFLSSEVTKMVRFPILPGSQVVKMVRFPVFPRSQVSNPSG